MRTFAAALAMSVALACTPCVAAAQSMAGMAMDEATPPEKSPPPIAIAGLGNSSIAITTSGPEAQRWFNQGLNELHDFWDYESARAFEQSIRVDPNCAMCYWGLYKAEAFRGENDGYAAAALKQAEKLAKHATPAEKLYIQAAKEEEKETEAEAKRSKAPKPGGWDVAGVSRSRISIRRKPRSCANSSRSWTQKMRLMTRRQRSSSPNL